MSHSCGKLDRWKCFKARQIRVANGHVHVRVPDHPAIPKKIPWKIIPFPSSLFPFVLNPASPVSSLESCYLLFLAPPPPFFNLLLLLSWRNVIQPSFFYWKIKMPLHSFTRSSYCLLLPFFILRSIILINRVFTIITPSSFPLILLKNLLFYTNSSSNFIYIHKLFSHSISFHLPLPQDT